MDSLHPLGVRTPDKFSEIFGTGFIRFHAPSGIRGLALPHEATRTVAILAVQATQEGAGQFRAFISALKEHYDRISVIEIWNPVLEATLSRYGFKPEMSVIEGEPHMGMVWQSDSRYVIG